MRLASTVGYFLLSWIRSLWSLRAASAALGTFGAMWLALELANYFFSGASAISAIQHNWLLFGIAGLMIAGFRCRPRNSVCYQLSGRDVSIEIFIGDLFSIPGSLVVGTNTTFDTQISSHLISERSVQGQFTKRYYASEDQLDRELDASLAGETHVKLTGRRLGKSKLYPVGACAKLDLKERTTYFVAICELNEHGNASGTFDDLQESLASLWSYIGKRGSRDGIVTPILGTGFGRITQTRQQVIHEIVRSFIAACSEMVFADKLTIVISAKDAVKHNISLGELGEFLKLQCVYNGFAPSGGRARGTAV